MFHLVVFNLGLKRNHLEVDWICEVMTVCLCFWEDPFGSKALKIEEKSNSPETLDLVKEVKPTLQGTNNGNFHFIYYSCVT